MGAKQALGDSNVAPVGKQFRLSASENLEAAAKAYALIEGREGLRNRLRDMLERMDEADRVRAQGGR